MTHKRVRTQAAVITTGLALAALLVGPAVTLGLDVPVVGSSAPTATQVAATTQTVVQNTQQTAATTVTNVQNTVQTTVQAPAAPAAPVTQQVQSAAPVATAPKQAPAKTAAPAQKPSGTSAPAKSPVRQISSKAALTRQAASAATGSVRNAAGATTQVTRAGKLTRSKAGAPATAAPAAGSTRGQHASSCTGLPVLDLLPGELASLLSAACNAADLVVPIRLGTARGADPVVPVSDLLVNATGAVLPLLARAADLQRVLHRFSDRQSGIPASALAESPRGTNALAGVAAGGSSSAHPSSYWSGATYAHATTPAATQPSAHSAGHRHLGILSQPVDGTSVLSLVLLLDAALLAAIVMWRVAQRWLVPRFA